MTGSRSTEKTNRNRHNDWFFFRRPTRETIVVDDETLTFFRRFPDQIDRITTPSRIHGFLLASGVSLGLIIIVPPKVIAHPTGDSRMRATTEAISGDVVTVCSVVLIGSALKAFFVSLLLNHHQERANSWRKPIRRRICEQTS